MLRFLFSILPANLISFLTGWIVRWRLPAPLQCMMNNGFVRLFSIQIHEAEKKTAEYESIEEVFTRRLKNGARHYAPPYCSPADGKIVISKAAAQNEALQVKRFQYDLSELVYGEKNLKNFSWYTTVYLAPHNYHRVHSPMTGLLRRMIYIPGFLWPVNEMFVGMVPELFCRNERLVFEIEIANKGRCFVVMVGAFNVGRMASPFWKDFTTNGFLRQISKKTNDVTFNNPISISCGDELGTFMLGSTVVCVLDELAAEYAQPYVVTQTAEILVGAKLSVL